MARCARATPGFPFCMFDNWHSPWHEPGAQSVFVEESANVLSSYFLHLLLLTQGGR